MININFNVTCEFSSVIFPFKQEISVNIITTLIQYPKVKRYFLLKMFKIDLLGYQVVPTSIELFT